MSPAPAAAMPDPEPVSVSSDAWLSFAPPEPEAAETAPAEIDEGFTSFNLDPTGEDRIHELSEFGAVRIGDEPGSSEPADDRIHDLEEFGAVRVA